jgi:hypothetical protein
MSFTDQQILQQLQYVAIEPPDLGATWPSGLWTRDEVIDYLNQRQNRFLKDTHFQIGMANIPVTQGVNSYDLPDDWIATVRVLWQPASGGSYELTRSDAWEADYGMPTWSYVEGPLKTYMDVDSPALMVKLAPLPPEDGNLLYHYVPMSVTLDGNEEIFTLPDEYVPTIKYGALADMLNKVGRATDKSRAEYCEQRYQLGLDIANMLLHGWKD